MKLIVVERQEKDGEHEGVDHEAPFWPGCNRGLPFVAHLPLGWAVLVRTSMCVAAL
jgi:hypothetical protein